MSFKLPTCPISRRAGALHVAETLEYHHDKHHQAYVNNGNKLLKGTGWKASRWKRS